MTKTHYERMGFRHGGQEAFASKDLKTNWFAGELERAIQNNQADAVPFGVWLAMQEKGAPAQVIAEGFTTTVRMVVHRLMDQLSDPYSYSLLTQDPQYVRLYHRMLQMGGKVVVQPSMMADYHGLTYERAGKRTYDVHPDLAERLVHTELRGLVADDLRLPYEAVYFIVPGGTGLKVWNNESEWHWVEGIYVVEDRRMRVGDEVGKSTGPEVRGWRIMVVGAPKGKIDYGGVKLDDDALSYFRVLLPEGRSLDDCIKATVDEIEWSMKAGTGLWSEKMSDDWTAHFRWVMNAVLYATWEEPGEHWEANREARQLWERIQKMPKGSRKRENLLQKAKGIPRQPRLRLGYKVVVNRHAPKPESMGTEKSGAFREGVGVRTRVAGHWRKQAFGPGRTERKIIWIEPHWRNLDGVVPAEEPMHVMK